MTPISSKRSAKQQAQMPLATGWLLFGLLFALGNAAPTEYKIPNPFKRITDSNVNDFYHIRAFQSTGQHAELIEEYFSLGLGLSYSVHTGLRSRTNKQWAILADGRDTRSYIVHDWHQMEEGQEPECELDHVHDHKRIYPWQYVYDKSRLTVNEKYNGSDKQQGGSSAINNNNTATIYGLGAIWLNLIKAGVRSSLVGPGSPHGRENVWQKVWKDLKLEMLFEKRYRMSDDVQTAQDELDETKLIRFHLESGLLHKNLSERFIVEWITVEKFISGLKEEEDSRLKKFRLLLELCKEANKRHRQFPSLMRALAGTERRAYKIDYVTQRYNSFAIEELDGKYNENKHRFMWPYDLTKEVLSLTDDVQSFLYGGDGIDEQGRKRQIKRVDMFQMRYDHLDLSRNDYILFKQTCYHKIANVGDTKSCIQGECELQPKKYNSLFSRMFTFKGRDARVYEGLISGLGALLMNAAHMHYKSWSLFSFDIRVPDSYDDMNIKHDVEAEVWQIVDKRGKVRVLFFFEKRKPALEPLQWDLAERDRQELARLVRIDLRAIEEEEDGASSTASYIIDQALVDSKDGLLARYHIFKFDLEPPDQDLEVFLKIHEECKNPTLAYPATPNSSANNPINTAINYEQEFDKQQDELDDEQSDEPVGLAEGYEQFMGVEKAETPLPDLIELLGAQTHYTILTRLQLLGEPSKHMWIREEVDLLAEFELIRVYSSSEDLARSKPDEEIFIYYKSELIFRLDKDGSCLRIEDNDIKWLRLLSGHFNYYKEMAPTTTTNGTDDDHNDLVVVESNKLSLYGFGALWRRASQSELAEFLGSRRERVERDGRKYKQLEWLYEEFDMTTKWTFLLEDGRSDQEKDSHTAPMPQLESVLISSKSPGGTSLSLSRFKQLDITVVEFTSKFEPVEYVVPVACFSALKEAQRQIVYDQERQAPSIERVLGKSQHYEIDYSVHKLKASASGEQSIRHLTALNNIRFSESFDGSLNRGKILVRGRDSGIEIEFYIDGQSKRIFMLNKQSSKCQILTEFGQTFNSIFGKTITGNPDFDSGQVSYGLLGLWKALSSKGAKLLVKQFYDHQGALHENQIYTIERERNQQGTNKDGYEEIRMHFEKKPPATTNFDHSRKMLIRQEHDFKLNRIQLRHLGGQLQQQQDDESEFVDIVMNRQENKLSEKWELPADCQKLISDSSGQGSSTSSGSPASSSEAPLKAGKLPKLSKLLQQSKRFRMRSQVHVQGRKLDYLYLIDEFYNEGNVRIRTHGFVGRPAERKCDLLMFADTQSQYDVSVPLKCAQLFGPSKSHCLSAIMNSVWLGGWFQVMNLASLHYAPLTMWELAETRRAEGISTKLIKRVDLSSFIWASRDDASLEAFKKQLEQEMDREMWLVSGTIDGRPTDWSYEMQFVKKQQTTVLEDGRQGLEEWHVLESITANDIIEGDPVSVSIEVIKYDEQIPDKDAFGALFRLPEGWNCRRNSSATAGSTNGFKLNLDLSSAVQLGYEASLELFDPTSEIVYEDDELGVFRVRTPGSGEGHLPTLAGTYSTGDNLARGLKLSVHQSLARFTDGRSLASRTISDRDRSLQYELDLISGACVVINTNQNGNWRLSFPGNIDGKSMTHVINMIADGSPLSELSNRDLFKQLFIVEADSQSMGNNQFYKVNEYSVIKEGHAKKEVLYSVYEGELNNLRLTDTLGGPARVIRRYEEELNDNHRDVSSSVVADDIDKRVDYMSAQVYLLSADKSKLRAILTVRLIVHRPLGLSEFLDLASVTDCYNEANSLTQRQQLGSLTLEYPLVNEFTPAFGHSIIEVLKENFYANLLRSSGTKLLPLQLDGRAHLEFVQHDRLLRIHFNVLETPSAMIYFNRRSECTMNERIEAVAESRLLPNLAACSSWCDQINCLAMSYCQDDRQCRVATEAAVFGPMRHKPENKTELETRRADLVSLTDCATARTDCTYYYNKSGMSPRTLASLCDYLDRVVNKRSNKRQLMALGLPLNLIDYDSPLVVHNRIEPTRFYESSDTFLWQHEDIEEPSQTDLISLIGDVSIQPSTLPGLDSGGLQLAATSSFSLWKAHSRFDANKIELLNKELKLGQNSKFIIASTAALNQAGCLKECQRNDCLLVNSCKQSSQCELLSATGSISIMSLGALKSELIGSDSSQCSISIHDHLDKFHMFENSRKPAKYWHKLEDYTAQECAAACHLNQADCLAFDLCTFSYVTIERRQARSVCFLQRDHVTQDSFDRSVLLPSWDIDSNSTNQNTIDGRQVDCDHYSKSVLAEFRRVPNAKVRKLHGSILRGISVDRCAVDCLRDDACRAFEHCQNPKRHPTQSCYLIRSSGGHSLDLTGLIDQGVALATIASVEMGSKTLEDQLIISKGCSIYLASDALGQKRLEQTLAIGADDGAYPTSYDAVMICIYLLIATLLGAVLQFAYIRLARQPLTLWPMAN